MPVLLKALGSDRLLGAPAYGVMSNLVNIDKSQKAVLAQMQGVYHLSKLHDIQPAGTPPDRLQISQGTPPPSVLVCSQCLLLKGGIAQTCDPLSDPSLVS